MAISQDEVNIVLERLRVMPRTVKLNIGNYGSFTRDELIEEVSNKTEIGKLVVNMHMSYLRSFKERAKP
jgi:hypothetical protein